VVIVDREGFCVRTLYSNVAIIECVSQAELDQLLAAGLRRYLVRRLSDTAAMIDHQRLADVHKLLKRLGETPRVVVE
jgi:hypothetical protein